SMADGPLLYQLAKDAGSLDVNSAYAYTLPGLHHAEASVLAEIDGVPAGFISGYWMPETTDSNIKPLGKGLFIWQMAVHPDFRKRGLSQSMIETILIRKENTAIRYIETTITPSNTAS